MKSEQKSSGLNSPKTDVYEVLQWSSQLAAETLQDPKREDGYVETDGWTSILNKLVNLNGQLIAITGPQGAGKSTTLNRLFWEANRGGISTILSRTADPRELFKFRRIDQSILMTYKEPTLRTQPEAHFSVYQRRLFEKLKTRNVQPTRASQYLPQSSNLLDVDWAERKLGSKTTEQIQWETWRDHSRKTQEHSNGFPRLFNY